MRIKRPLDRFGADIFIVRFGGVRQVQVMHFDADGEGIVETHDVVSAVKPTMRIGMENEVREVLAAFLVEASDFGVKHPDESHAVGKLEATALHLADMRRLAFEGKDRDLSLSLQP